MRSHIAINEVLRDIVIASSTFSVIGDPTIDNETEAQSVWERQ